MSYHFNPFTGNLDDIGADAGLSVPGNPDTSIQFNDGGSFGGDVGLTYNKTSDNLMVGVQDTVTATNSLVSGDFNAVSGNCNLVTGKQNTMQGDFGVIGGQSNVIGLVARGMAWGSGNTINSGATDSQTIGFGNLIDTDCYDNILIGSSNIARAQGGNSATGVLIMGSTNIAEGAINFAYMLGVNLKNTGADNSITIGKGASFAAPLLNTTDNSILMGMGQYGGFLNFASITTSHKTFTFPNVTGTLALTSDIPVGADPSATIGLTSNVGTATTFMRSDATPALGVGIIPTWTGVHTFSLQDIHNAGLSLGTSGVLTSAIVAGATTYQYEMQDTNAISLTGFFMRFRNTNSSANIIEITRDGRYSFGWNAQTQLGHVLFFLANDSTLAIAGSPVTAGINASVMHNNAAESPARHWGLVGVQGFGTATGFTPALSGAVLGVAVASPDTLMAGKVHASFVGRFQNINNVNNNESASIDRSLTSAAHYRAGVDHLTVYWADCANASGSVNYPTAGNGIPAICSSARLPIQDYACGITAGAPFGELWAIRGQTKQGTIVMKPLITGYIFMTYPRRTSEATTRAMHAHWEPWANTATTRANAAVGDTYFDDGTNFLVGIHQSVVAGAYQALLYPAANANGAVAAGNAGNITGTWAFTQNVTVANLTDSGLTITRVPYASTAGLLIDSANMTYDGNRLTPKWLTLAAGTATAGQAPLKLTTQASPLTVVEQGAFELVGNSLQFTQLAKRRGVAMTQATRTSSFQLVSSASESATMITAEHGANYLEVGKMEEIRLYGTLQKDVGTPTNALTIRVKYAGATIDTVVSSNAAVTANTPIKIIIVATCRTTGATGTLQVNTIVEIAGDVIVPGVPVLTTIDTTTAQDTTVTAQFTNSSATNNLVIHQGRVLCIEPNK